MFCANKNTLPRVGTVACFNFPLRFSITSALKILLKHSGLRFSPPLAWVWGAALLGLMLPLALQGQVDTVGFSEEMEQFDADYFAEDSAGQDSALQDSALADSLSQTDSLQTDSATAAVTDSFPGLAPEGFRQRTIWHYSLQGLPNRQLWRKTRRIYRKTENDYPPPQQDSLALAFLQAAGYPSAERVADTSFSKKPRHKTRVVRFRTGPRLVYGQIRTDSLPEDQRNAGHLDRATRKQRPFSLKDLNQRLSAILDAYQQEGYPFASFQVTQLQYKQLPEQVIAVEAHTVFSPGPFVTIDSILVNGDIREKASFLGSVARIHRGDAYDQAAVNAVPRLLNNSLYYTNTQPPRVRFWDNRATLEIPVERQKANRFDGLLGLLPPRDESQKLEFTGLLDLQLVSALRMGEVLRLKFEKLVGASQELNASYLQPNLFGTPFQAELRFRLLKQDTLFLIQTLEPTGYYRFSRTLTGKFYYRATNSSLLSTDPYSEVNWPPPPVLNARSRSYGIGLIYNSVDYMPNPSRGVFLDTEVGYGQKKIIGTAGLDSLDTERLTLTQPQTEGRLQFNAYFPTFGTQVLVLGAQAYWLELVEYFDSDQRFVGGSRSLRGFNENEFLARLYGIGTLEYRLRLDVDSYLGLFYDWAYLEYAEFEQMNYLRPMGVGLAFSFRTPAGIMSVSYGLGQVGDQRFQPTRGRVHIGLVNNF